MSASGTVRVRPARAADAALLAELGARTFRDAFGALNDPAELARRYNREGIDELVILDITATIERRRALADTIRAVSYSGYTVAYCSTCQTAGKILADNTTSKFLK